MNFSGKLVLKNNNWDYYVPTSLISYRLLGNFSFLEIAAYHVNRDMLELVYDL